MDNGQSKNWKRVCDLVLNFCVTPLLQEKQYATMLIDKYNQVDIIESFISFNNLFYCKSKTKGKSKVLILVSN